MNANSNVLITGTSGFVGFNLSKYLAERGFIIEPLSLRKKNWKSLISDNPDFYIHLAGKAHDLKNTSDEQAYFDINTELTKNLFAAFQESKAKTFIYFSSVKAVADEVKDILTEYVDPDPKTAYGKSKLAAEQFLLSQDLIGKKIIIIRPCMIHGPGNKGNLNLLYQFVNKGIPYPLAAFHNSRSFLGIENLCFMIEKILKAADIPSGIYNLADDGSLSTNQLIRIIAGAIGKRSRLWSIPVSIMKGLAKLGDILKLPLNSDRLQKLTENYVVCNTKIKSALNIDKMPVPIEDGLRKTIASFSDK
ncbi:MAG: NAD-dependent epimerase/dehydratase family protein [Taibaiella sp.]|nr:NAD-dependent epimerase/dehydratase family protein [Taibaiella sp.]